MSYSLTWLSSVLLDAGLKVAEVPGWEKRGRGDVGDIVGVICHHTAGPRAGNMPSLGTLLQGRPDLSPPLAQLGLGRDGTFYVVAAGRCNHAGAGVWQGSRLGNSNFIGIEAENTGLPDDSPWPEVQVECYQRGVAAILRHIGRSEMYCAGHKEYALPPGRKKDPDLDMHAFRGAVAQLLSSAADTAALIPKIEPARDDGGTVRPTLRRLDRNDYVDVIQEKLGLPKTGFFDEKTEAAVRAFQRERNVVADGIVGPKTWKLLDAN
ncbi:peptidoglycan-binding protein [Caballeronia mineralivorans PML1(12)]|uniref:Peptidoglycan-binding protein n=1 Tax=Caballeronia mineralivorans PML1(12) TaxID=908627 RepID=A0A0J1FT27_9BURK|nr:N-acetylmuramoyl-L-alanine amidase [Caballeronia mineralivorans]KLU22958.1 peptidoglycan-binding protein [Caballeronia mineralivorans PML1(12)]